MKRIYKIMFLIFLTGSVPLSSALGQEKKSEQKIKVVIADESGTKTVIDTTFTGDSMPGTITLKDGKVIVLDKSGTDIILKESSGGNEKVLVTVTSDNKGEKRKEEKIIIMSSDSVEWTGTSTGDKGQVYVYSTIKSSGGKPGSKIIIASAGDKKTEPEGDKVVIVKDGKIIKKDGEKSFDVYVGTDEIDSDTDVTRYVVAKDGLVVTVEGKDEARVKELIKEIQSKLGVKNNEEGKKEAVITETGKAVKK